MRVRVGAGACRRGRHSIPRIDAPKWYREWNHAVGPNVLKQSANQKRRRGKDRLFLMFPFLYLIFYLLTICWWLSLFSLDYSAKDICLLTRRMCSSCFVVQYCSAMFVWYSLLLSFSLFYFLVCPTTSIPSKLLAESASTVSCVQIACPNEGKTVFPNDWTLEVVASRTGGNSLNLELEIDVS